MSFSGSVCKCCAEPGGDLYWCLVAARNGHPTCPSLLFTKINFISTSFVFVLRSDWQMYSHCGWLVVSVRLCTLTPVIVLCLLCAFGKGIYSIFFNFLFFLMLLAMDYFYGGKCKSSHYYIDTFYFLS